jgi:hypothetical protein
MTPLEKGKVCELEVQDKLKPCFRQNPPVLRLDKGGLHVAWDALGDRPATGNLPATNGN